MPRLTTCCYCGVVVGRQGLAAHQSGLRCAAKVNQNEMNAQGMVHVYPAWASRLKKYGVPVVKAATKYRKGGRSQRAELVHQDHAPIWAVVVYRLIQRSPQALHTEIIPLIQSGLSGGPRAQYIAVGAALLKKSFLRDRSEREAWNNFVESVLEEDRMTA